MLPDHGLVWYYPDRIVCPRDGVVGVMPLKLSIWGVP